MTRPSYLDPHHCTSCCKRDRPLSVDAMRQLYVKKITPSLTPTDFESSFEYDSLFKAWTAKGNQKKRSKYQLKFNPRKALSHKGTHNEYKSKEIHQILNLGKEEKQESVIHWPGGPLLHQQLSCAVAFFPYDWNIIHACFLCRINLRPLPGPSIKSPKWRFKVTARFHIHHTCSFSGNVLFKTGSMHSYQPYGKLDSCSKKTRLLAHM